MKYLSIALKHDHIMVPVSQIMYFMAILENKLSANKFFRIHHGTIVNTRYIRKINIKESSIELICGRGFNIAQRKKGKFKKALEQFTQFI